MREKNTEEYKEKMLELCEEIKKKFSDYLKEVMQKSTLSNVEVALPICLNRKEEIFLGEPSFGTRYLSILKDCVEGNVLGFFHTHEKFLPISLLDVVSAIANDHKISLIGFPKKGLILCYYFPETVEKEFLKTLVLQTTSRFKGGFLEIVTKIIEKDKIIKIYMVIEKYMVENIEKLTEEICSFTVF